NMIEFRNLSHTFAVSTDHQDQKKVGWLHGCNDGGLYTVCSAALQHDIRIFVFIQSAAIQQALTADRYISFAIILILSTPVLKHRFANCFRCGQETWGKQQVVSFCIHDILIINQYLPLIFSMQEGSSVMLSKTKWAPAFSIRSRTSRLSSINSSDERW